MASSCAAVDKLVQKFTALRLLAVGCVVLWRVGKLSKTIEGSNFMVRFMKAGLLFAAHEGLGMLLYFSISAVLDLATVFLVPMESYCEAEKLAAIYTAALIFFLPNALYSRCFQQKYWDDGNARARVGFITGAVVLTSISFLLRCGVVFSGGWISVVQHSLGGLSVTTRAALASAIPPVVDVIQSIVLISVTHMKRDDKHGSYHALNGEPAPNLLQSGSAEKLLPKKTMTA